MIQPVFVLFSVNINSVSDVWKKRKCSLTLKIHTLPWRFYFLYFHLFYLEALTCKIWQTHNFHPDTETTTDACFLLMDWINVFIKILFKSFTQTSHFRKLKRSDLLCSFQLNWWSFRINITDSFRRGELSGSCKSAVLTLNWFYFEKLEKAQRTSFLHESPSSLN